MGRFERLTPESELAKTNRVYRQHWEAQEDTDGDFYMGEVERLTGQKDGRGIYVFADGSVQSGIWQNDMLNGECSLYDCTGDIYKGQY